MSDGQESRGDMPYEPTRCECRHLVTFHAFNTKGQRATCTRTDCACRRFVAAQEVASHG